MFIFEVVALFFCVIVASAVCSMSEAVLLSLSFVRGMPCCNGSRSITSICLLLRTPANHYIGIIAMEEVLEELFGDIYDEKDVKPKGLSNADLKKFEDNLKKK